MKKYNEPENIQNFLQTILRKIYNFEFRISHHMAFFWQVKQSLSDIFKCKRVNLMVIGGYIHRNKKEYDMFENLFLGMFLENVPFSEKA